LALEYYKKSAEQGNIEALKNIEILQCNEISTTSLSWIREFWIREFFQAKDTPSVIV
jgi:TPR repeat protein